MSWGDRIRVFAQPVTLCELFCPEVLCKEFANGSRKGWKRKPPLAAFSLKVGEVCLRSLVTERLGALSLTVRRKLADLGGQFDLLAKAIKAFAVANRYHRWICRSQRRPYWSCQIVLLLKHK